MFSTGIDRVVPAASSWNGYDNNIARMTGNVLTRFADPEPLEQLDVRP